MGLGPSAVKLYLELWQRGFFKDIKSVVEMGSEEIHMRVADFEELIQCSGIPHYSRESFPNIENWPAQPRSSSKPLFKLFGVENYTSLDLNGEHGAIKHDLNNPLDEKHWGKFDLVTDHGTNEHAFNVFEAYRTMHRLCKPNGYIVISQMIYGGNGYYHFDLSFFEGLAAANGYKVLFSSYEIFDHSSGKQFHVPLSRELFQMFDFSKLKGVGICYVFQKSSDKDFTIPYQGNFLSEVQKNKGYELQFLPVPPTRTYVPKYASIDLRAYPLKSLIKAILKKLT